jgi:hypothetical protein
MDLGDFLWSLLVIFFMVVYFMIIFSIIGDLFRSKDIGGVAKAIWMLVILFFPLISPLIYLIVRGSGMTDRAVTAAQHAQQQQVAMAREVVSASGGDGAGAGGSAADQIARGKDLLDSGAISAEEYDALKKKALG